MSDLFDRVAQLFEDNAQVGTVGLRDDSQWAPQPLRDAAVLMAVTDAPEPGLLLTHRPKTMAAHPGQVAFPGGKLEPGEDAIAAALREAEEELAIPPAMVRVVGSAQAFATGTGFNLTPVLGVVPAGLPITPDPREVDGWFEAPLRFVLDRRNHVRKMGNFGGFELPYTEITWESHRIWGITAGIIANLSHRLVWEDLLG
ncbi:CoA pyrophosphatase [Aurantiacibacter aquimixticola]|uniref:CoA pyrophosphatase n=1 Tax=Aurantiacibacter aquimixticola TaxID=1958945 RepID=A0A419RR22_9SPHN|nr:CoA pyrophosphatase [Aurantiacibacter aquimixticola]RJY08217.1 CoA pyrophosphatase [Aurantiacibacter aquimixticola]